MTDENTDEVVQDSEEETKTEVEIPEIEETPKVEDVEPTSEEKLAAMETKLAKSEADKENYKKAALALKKNKPKEVALIPNKDGLVTKEEFYKESQNKATAKAVEQFPELARDKHWNEIIKDYYHSKTRDGKSVEENTFLNLKNAMTLWKAEHPDTDDSGKTATAKVAQSNASPSKGDTSQSKKSDNTEVEQHYLDKFGLSDK